MREYCEEELLVWVFPNHKCQKSCQISKTHFTLCDNLTFLFWKLHHVVVKCEHEFYCNFVKCEHGFLFYSFDIIVVFNNVKNSFRFVHTMSNPFHNYRHITEYPVRHGDSPHFLWAKHLQCTLGLRERSPF